MKKWMTLPFITALLMAVGLIPGWILAQAPAYSVIAPTVSSYQSSIRTTGALYPQYTCEIITSGNYEVAEVFVSVGEEVEQGQTLARVKSINTQSFYTYENKERGASSIPSQWEEMAKLYGGSAEEYTENSGSWDVVQSFLNGQPGTEEELFVTAPISGVVASRLPLTGTVIRAGEALCSVNSSHSWTAQLSLTEKQAAQVGVGDTVRVTSDNFAGGEAWGTVTEISPTARKVLGGTGYDTVVDIEVALAGIKGNFTAGISVKAEVFTGEPRELLALPYEAIYQDSSNQEYVLVASSHGLVYRAVETGTELAEGVEIALGLSREERVAVIPYYNEKLPRIFLLQE